MRPGLRLVLILAWAMTAWAAEALPSSGIAPWPGGVVVYRFDPSVFEPERQAFLRALALWEAPGSPVAFREDRGSWVSSLAWALGLDRSLLVREDRRLTSFGRTTLGAGNRREMVFNPSRSPEGWLDADLAHELGHALGLTHEHQRRDRDQFVAFPPGFLDSLGPDRAADYALNPTDPAPDDPWPYDWDSLMHYSSNIDGNRMVRRDTGDLIPGALGPSAGDWGRLARLYSPRPQEVP